MFVQKVMHAFLELASASWHHMSSTVHKAMYTVRVKCGYELLSPLWWDELIFLPIYEQCWSPNQVCCHHLSILRVLWQKGSSLTHTSEVEQALKTMHLAYGLDP